MKKLLILVVSALLPLMAYGQTDSTKTWIKENHAADCTRVGQYKVIPTINAYTSLLLDTAYGRVWQIQIGVGDVEPLEKCIVGSDANLWCCAPDDRDARIYYWEHPIIGRFQLYPTNNSWNFLLVDTCYGDVWQVQWGKNALYYKLN